MGGNEKRKRFGETTRVGPRKKKWKSEFGIYGRGRKTKIYESEFDKAIKMKERKTDVR